jgi:ubiquitin-protein ligase
MVTPTEQRNLRLKNDYQEMCKIRGSIIDWEPLEGNAPYITKYKLIVKVNSIIGSEPTYRNEHVLEVLLSPSHPDSPPLVTMISNPVIFHPHWYTNNRYCYGSYSYEESLGTFVIRMIKSLQFNPNYINEKSPANRSALGWYKSNKHLTPCDKQLLPDPSRTSKTFTFNDTQNSSQGKVFRIDGFK